jgi:hypothetical protein
MMRGLVVFESMFGNTQEIAKAVADGLASRMRVDIVEVGSAPDVLDEDIEVLVVGAPTHAFGMSRARTRADAVRQAGEVGVVSGSGGIREWLARLSGSRVAKAATFDTRIAKPRVPGSAARAAERRLRRLHFPVLGHSCSFYVTGTLGPLVDGETTRARRWGEGLAARATQSPEADTDFLRSSRSKAE